MPYRQRVPFTLATKAIPPLCLRPDNTALLIQDMQRILVDPEYGLGKVANERGILIEFDPYYQQVEKVTENITRLKERVTTVGMPVIYTRLAYDRSQGSMPSTFQRAIGLAVPIDAEGSEIIPALAPTEEDFIILKKGFGGFSGETGLNKLLKGMGVDNIIVTGAITEFGVRGTAAGAQDLGYHPLVISDGTASMTHATQSRTLGEICYGLTKVRSTGEVLTYLDEMVETDGKFV